jgi:hypothetical protein
LDAEPLGLSLPQPTIQDVRLHYVEARKAVEAGLVAVVAIRPPDIGTFTYEPDTEELAFLTHPDGEFRSAALLAFMERAHERIVEECG